MPEVAHAQHGSEIKRQYPRTRRLPPIERQAQRSGQPPARSLTVGEDRGELPPMEGDTAEPQGLSVPSTGLGRPLGDPHQQQPVHWGNRLAWFILFALPTAVFITAALLTPNPHGHGTHTQLGLPPCGFLVMTGLPCPGCGLTTSFTFIMHGDLVSAAYANPFGLLLFFVSFSCAVTALLGLVRGWPVVPVLERLHAERWAILLAVGSLLTWGIRLASSYLAS